MLSRLVISAEKNWWTKFQRKSKQLLLRSSVTRLVTRSMPFQTPKRPKFLLNASKLDSTKMKQFKWLRTTSTTRTNKSWPTSWTACLKRGRKRCVASYWSFSPKSKTTFFCWAKKLNLRRSCWDKSAQSFYLLRKSSKPLLKNSLRRKQNANKTLRLSSRIRKRKSVRSLNALRSSPNRSKRSYWKIDKLASDSPCSENLWTR